MNVISPTLKLVIHRTLPLTVGLFAIMLVQLVDSIFIGLLGVDELAVHGMTLPFQVALIGIQVGIGVAVTAIISQAAGANNTEKAANIATLGVLFGTVCVSLVCLLLFDLGDMILALFVLPEMGALQLVTLATIFEAYWPIWLFSSVTLSLFYLVTCVYRANEDTKLTGTMFVVASLINLVLDPVLIFTFEMGIAGAAVASSIGYIFGAIFMLVRAKNRRWFKSVCICLKPIGHLGELVRVALPTTANQLLPSLGAFVAMVIVSRMGTDVIAFWSLMSRIESFILVFTLALTMSIPPLVGRYLGADQIESITGLLITAVKFLLLFHLGIVLVLILISDPLIPVINNAENIQYWLKSALWLMPLSYGPLGLCMLAVSVFNALGAPKSALWLSFIRLFVLYIPAIWVGSLSGDVFHTLIAAMLANMMAGLFAWYKLRQHLKWQLYRPNCAVEAEIG